MSVPLDHEPPLDDATWIADLLGERAGSVHPRGTTTSSLVRRSAMVRHRRRAAAVGAGLVATTAAGAVVVVGRSSTPANVVEAGPAARSALTEPGSTMAPLVVPASPTGTGSPLVEPLPRLGLAVPGAAVQGVFDGSDAAPAIEPAAAAVELVDTTGRAPCRSS